MTTLYDAEKNIIYLVILPLYKYGDGIARFLILGNDKKSVTRLYRVTSFICLLIYLLILPL